MTTSYQWQRRNVNEKQWVNDGKSFVSRRLALAYGEILHHCPDCGGHRLIKTVTSPSGKVVKTRLFYTRKLD